MNHVHVMFQSKGGVGKSLAASFLAQYLKTQRKEANEILVANADDLLNSPTNAQWTGAAIDGTDLDPLTATILAHDGDAVVDTGPSSYLAMGTWLTAPGTMAQFQATDLTLTVHYIVVGGVAQAETLQGLLRAVQSLPPSVRLVVWLNDFFGPIVSPGGGSFETMKIYTENRARIWGIIRLNIHGRDAFKFDLQRMLERRQTFEEAIADPKVGLISRQRLTMLRREIFGSMALVP